MFNGASLYKHQPKMSAVFLDLQYRIHESVSYKFLSYEILISLSVSFNFTCVYLWNPFIQDKYQKSQSNVS